VHQQVLTGLLLPWPAGGGCTSGRAWERLADLWPGRLTGGDAGQCLAGSGGSG